jgi:TPR repeat protein
VKLASSIVGYYTVKRGFFARLLRPLVVLIGIQTCHAAQAPGSLTTPQYNRLLAAAERGDPAAELRLAYGWLAGIEQFGWSKSDTNAFQWFKKAAEHGEPTGQWMLGTRYELGVGVSQNFARAVQWYKTAAESGNPRGECNYARCLFEGKGVNRNPTEAVNRALALVSKPSLRDNQAKREAQGLLSYAYRQGDGVPKDLVEAYKWAVLSASLPDNQRARDELEAQLGTREIEEGTRRAADWTRQQTANPVQPKPVLEEEHETNHAARSTPDSSTEAPDENPTPPTPPSDSSLSDVLIATLDKATFLGSLAAFLTSLWFLMVTFHTSRLWGTIMLVAPGLAIGFSALTLVLGGMRLSPIFYVVAGTSSLASLGVYVAIVIKFWDRVKIPFILQMACLAAVIVTSVALRYLLDHS